MRRDAKWKTARGGERKIWKMWRKEENKGKLTKKDKIEKKETNQMKTQMGINWGKGRIRKDRRTKLKTGKKYGNTTIQGEKKRIKRGK